MRGKAGATGWTVGKLLTLVLVVAVLALVIYGYSTGAITPLKNKIVGMYDGVLIMFGIKDEGGAGGGDGCSILQLEKTEDGRKFLENIGLSKDKYSGAILTLCVDGECKIDGTGIGSYRIKDEVFSRWIEDEWQKVDEKRYDKYFSENLKLEDVKFFSRFFRSSRDFVEERLGVKDIQEMAQEYGKTKIKLRFDIDGGDRKWIYWNGNGRIFSKNGIKGYCYRKNGEYFA